MKVGQRYVYKGPKPHQYMESFVVIGPDSIGMTIEFQGRMHGAGRSFRARVTTCPMWYKLAESEVVESILSKYEV